MDNQYIKGEKNYFVVVYGPPASGKSTMAQNIVASIEQCIKQKQQQFNYVLISADCCEEYLRNHKQSQLYKLLQKKQGWQQLNSLKLKRAYFSQDLWKTSRNFIKKHLPIWLHRWKIVILEDDLLLKSQRKQMRQIVETMPTLYIELYSHLDLEQCISNLKEREAKTNEQQHMPIEKLKDCYNKFESEESNYSMRVQNLKAISWKVIQTKAKKVIIQHPQLQQKQPITQQNAIKNSVQVEIRNFISELISNKQLRKQYFGDREIKQVSSIISKLKKSYKDKDKSVEGFIAFLKQETDKMI